jgi:hypothetical protein
VDEAETFPEEPPPPPRSVRLAADLGVCTNRACTLSYDHPGSCWEELVDRPKRLDRPPAAVVVQSPADLVRTTMRRDPDKVMGWIAVALLVVFDAGIVVGVARARRRHAAERLDSVEYRIDTMGAHR